jgi:hypothetical protein
MDDTPLLSNRSPDAIEEFQAGVFGRRKGTGPAAKGSDSAIV